MLIKLAPSWLGLPLRHHQKLSFRCLIKQENGWKDSVVSQSLKEPDNKPSGHWKNNHCVTPSRFLPKPMKGAACWWRLRISASSVFKVSPSLPSCVAIKTLTSTEPHLHPVKKMCVPSSRRWRKRGVIQGNRCEVCVSATPGLEITVISLKPFRGRVGRQKCRWKHCNENGNNNTAGQPSWIIGKRLTCTF